MLTKPPGNQQPVKNNPQTAFRIPHPAYRVPHTAKRAIVFLLTLLIVFINSGLPATMGFLWAGYIPTDTAYAAENNKLYFIHTDRVKLRHAASHLLSLFSTNVFAAEEGLYFVHSDHLGSTTVITDEAGEVVNQQRHYPYGTDRINADLTRIPTERAFTGQIKDRSTALHYYNARYYDPVLGTFTSADTADDGLNRFVYVGGNPIMSTDPSGNRILPPRNPWPWDPWISKLRERYYSSNYRQEQLSMNPAFFLSESVPFVSSLGLLGSAGLEALTGHGENARAALAGSVALLFPNNENPTALAMDIAGMSAVISAPHPWDGPGPGMDTIDIARDYSERYKTRAFTGRYRRRPENFYQFQEHMLNQADIVRRSGVRVDRQAWIDWASREGIDVYQVRRGHPKLGFGNRGISRGGSIYMDRTLDDLGFLETLGHELGHEFDWMKNAVTSSMETEARQTYWSQFFWRDVGDLDLADHYWRRYQLLRGRRPSR